MNPITDGVAGIVSAVGSIADDLFTSDEERGKLAIEGMKIEAGLVAGQLDVNKEEAKSASLFVSGWRPAVGWTGVLALVYQFVLYPLLVWGWAWMQAKQWVPTTQAAPPMLNTDALMVLLTGILGISGSRTFEKWKGVTK